MGIGLKLVIPGVEIPRRMDNRSLRVFVGYRVQHSGVREPAKGWRADLKRGPAHG